ncbi:intracellular endo-alpha-(1-_5)-L-arabinanase [Abditibacteriota bacterium]|nr:intracellular endo-alpha-(1->5)-L-arabinanase [Abditibacteriota bacterium]
MNILLSRRSRRWVCAALGLCGVFGVGCALWTPFARAVETNVEVRDPSTIVSRNGEYWIFGTGKGTQMFSSRDKIHWTKRGQVLATAPSWVATGVPGNKDNTVWAPDARFFGGKYHVYYSYSSMGSKESGIGVASNATLDPTTWHDDGLVVKSGGDTGFNTIDPCVFEGGDGKIYLSFGSYFDGIHMAEVDAQTGLLKSQPPYKLVAARANEGGAIEASYFYFHDGWYYGFVNFDGCCAGAKSSYNIRVGRSKNVFGPYLDKTGKDLGSEGGSLFWSATFDNGTGRPIDDQVGPGHVGIFKEGNDFWLTTHLEWSRARNGATTVNLNRLEWDADGWPYVVWDYQNVKIVSNLVSHDVVSPANKVTNGGALQTDYFDNGAGQKWNVQFVGNGFYSISENKSKLALSVQGEVKPGAPVGLATYANLPSQKWRFTQNDNGTYSLQSAANLNVSLDVSGGRPEDKTPLQVWTSNGLEPQNWSFRAR